MTTVFLTNERVEVAVAKITIRIFFYSFCSSVAPMIYTDMPLIIPVLATVYVLTIYLLLIIAQRTIKSSGYLARSLSDAYAPYLSTDLTPPDEEVERSQTSTVQEVSSLR